MCVHILYTPAVPSLTCTHPFSLLLQVSRVFDPLMYLSLPLPVEKTRWLEVHLVRIDPQCPVEKVNNDYGISKTTRVCVCVCVYCNFVHKL